jgi:hypothetical protein
MSPHLHWPPPAVLRRLTGAALLVTAVFVVIFGIHDRPLRPAGIVGYELAYTPQNALRLFEAWGAAGQLAARESLWIDFLFMPAYALLFAGLALGEARLARAGWVRRLGAWPAALPLAAWLFDFVENVALLRALDTPTAPPAGPLLAGAPVAEPHVSARHRSPGAPAPAER